MTDNFNKSQKMTLGSHDLVMLRGFLSLVSLVLDSGLFCISHLTKSIKEHEGRDTKRVRGALLVYTGLAPHLSPTAPFRVTLTPCHTSVCSEVCRLKFSSFQEGLHRVLNLKSRQKILSSTNKHGSILKMWMFFQIWLSYWSPPRFNLSQWISMQMQLTGWVKWE